MTENEQQNIFENWLQQHKALLFKVIRSYAFNANDREDLFQEITIQVWRSIPYFRKECAITTWIYRVSLNTAIRWSQKEKKQTDSKKSFEEIGHLLYENKREDERLEWLFEEIEKLHEIDRSLTLLMLDGFSYKEIAEIMGISESVVGVKIHRIKKYLIKKSEEYIPYGI
jgi:RNA polymerase sigma-70 factor (ECF subfamily)